MLTGRIRMDDGRLADVRFLAPRRRCARPRNRRAPASEEFMIYRTRALDRPVSGSTAPAFAGRPADPPPLLCVPIGGTDVLLRRDHD
jgi:hypothetical protein